MSYQYDVAKLKQLGKVIPFGSSEALPLMTVYRDKCLVINKSRTSAKFLVEGKDPSAAPDKKNDNIGYLLKKPIFHLDQSRTCVSLILVEL